MLHTYLLILYISLGQLSISGGYFLPLTCKIGTLEILCNSQVNGVKKKAIITLHPRQAHIASQCQTYNPTHQKYPKITTRLQSNHIWFKSLGSIVTQTVSSFSTKKKTKREILQKIKDHLESYEFICFISNHYKLLSFLKWGLGGGGGF